MMDGCLTYRERQILGRRRRAAHDVHEQRRRLRAGLPWHGQSMDRYRPIHRALSDSIDKGYEVTLTLLCNVEPGEDIRAVERRERARRGWAGSPMADLARVR